MNNLIQQITTTCPYCGERITLLADTSVEVQHYIEDCQVCCKPIEISLVVSEDGRCHLDTRTDSE